MFSELQRVIKQEVRRAIRKATQPQTEAQPQVQTEAHTLIFDKGKFSEAEARKWATKHDFFHSAVDETDSSFRIRQKEPGQYRSMHTLTPTDGVRAVVGKGQPGPSDVHVPVAGREERRKDGAPPAHPEVDEDLQVKVDKDGDDEPVRLDLGSGNFRPEGYVGMDQFPYDDLTIVHDLNETLPFEDGFADEIRAVNVLHELKSPESALEEICRVLKPGGTLHYEGPEEVMGYPDGLVMTDWETTEGQIDKDVDSGLNPEPKPNYRQVFVRVDAATANDSQPRDDRGDGYWADATTSAEDNQRLGYASQGASAQKSLQVSKQVPIMKVNSQKRIVYGVILSPDEVDAQDDWMTAEDIEKTAHAYLEKSRVIGVDHQEPLKAVPVESYIAPQDLEFTGQFGPQLVKKGAWVMGVRVDDPEAWEKVCTGEYTGFSVGGMGSREPAPLAD